MKIVNSGATSSQLKTLVFLTPRSVSAYEEKKWSFSYLRSQGFTIEVLDLTELLNKGLNLSELVTRPLQGSFIHHISSYQEFERQVRVFSDHSLFIDYLVAHSNVTLKEERLFRILKKSNAKYAFLSSGALPLPSLLETNARDKIKIIHSKAMKAIGNPYMLINFLASKIILFLTRHSIFYPLPAMIFGGESKILRRYIDARGIDKKTIVPINSFDYDASVLFLRGLGNKLPKSENICVFLDEAATHHSDFALLGIEPAAAEPYFSVMNRFFDFVEENMGLKVVIAAHPRSNYESMPDLFRGRAVIKGKTVELVARCKLVIMHMSTALSYPVLFKKPVIPIKIPGMQTNGQLNWMVETMGASIGSKPIDLDTDELTFSLLQRECNLEKYSEYEKCYIKTEGADELPEWEIVAKTLTNICHANFSQV